jgi:hypothetical protein
VVRRLGHLASFRGRGFGVHGASSGYGDVLVIAPSG